LPPSTSNETLTFLKFFALNMNPSGPFEDNEIRDT